MPNFWATMCKQTTEIYVARNLIHCLDKSRISMSLRLWFSTTIIAVSRVFVRHLCYCIGEQEIQGGPINRQSDNDNGK